MFGYTNQANPFGDNNLSEPFVWGKKLVKQKVEGKLDPRWMDGLKRKREDMKDEIESVKARRAQRELEKAQAEEQRALIQRQEEARNALEWESRGKVFDALQLDNRRDQRIFSRRPEAVDVLAKNISLLTMEEWDGYELDEREPPELIEALGLHQLRALKDDANIYITAGRDADYWRHIVELAQHRTDSINGTNVSDEGVHDAVMDEAIASLRKTPLPELEEMERDVQDKIQRGGSGVDVEFWMTMHKHVRLEKARAKLRAIHRQIKEAYDRLDKSYNPRGQLIVPEHHKPAGDEEMEEADFTEEVELRRRAQPWSDKFKPRRPKYFNRVHTGYEWNKYNSTHYDYDNPPPKVVMGYKFNIFFPDLVDPHQQPTYYVEPTEKGWKDDVCIIRFHAGPPYEDIAFKIVNKAWEYSTRRGFKCTFERGVLHLYFNFVRYRYRR